MTRLAVRALAAVAALAAAAHAGEPVRVEAPGFGSYFLLEAPAEAEGDAPRPLIVGLHGMGDKPENFLSCWGGIPSRRGYILAVPGGDQEAPCMCGQCGGTIRTWGGKSEKFVLWVIEEVRRRHPVDADRIYLAGFSAGAFATFHAGFRNPGLFAAIVACSGNLAHGVSIEQQECAKSMPVLGFAGEREPACFQMRRAFESLRKAGHLGVEFKAVPGLGHEVPVGELGGILDRFEALAAERREMAPTLRAELETARKALEGKGWAEAVPVLLGVADSGVHGPFAVEARGLLWKAGEEGNRRIEAALKGEGAGEREKAREALRAVARDFRGLPCAAKAEEAEQALLRPARDRAPGK